MAARPLPASDSGSGKETGSGSDRRESDPGNGPDTGKNSDPGRNSAQSKRDQESGKVLQAQAAWMAAVKELRRVEGGGEGGRGARRRKRRRSWISSRRRLLSAGRPGDVSLSEAFWAGGPGQGRDAAQGGGRGRVAGLRVVRGPAAGGSLGPRDAGPGLSEPGRSSRRRSSSTSARWPCGRPCKGPTTPTRPPAATSWPSPTGSPAAPTKAGRLFEQQPQFPRPRLGPGRPRDDAALREEARRGRAEAPRVPDHPPEVPARRLDDLRHEVGCSARPSWIRRNSPRPSRYCSPATRA